MGTTEIIVLAVVVAAAIAVAVIYMGANTREFEKSRKEAEDRRDEGGIDVLSSDHSAVDASVRNPTESNETSRQQRPDREVEEDRAGDIARERESHRL